MPKQSQAQRDLDELRERFGEIIAERDRDREALRLIVEQPDRALEIAQDRLSAATAEKRRPR